MIGWNHPGSDENSVQFVAKSAPVQTQSRRYNYMISDRPTKQIQCRFVHGPLELAGPKSRRIVPPCAICSLIIVDLESEVNYMRKVARQESYGVCSTTAWIGQYCTSVYGNCAIGEVICNGWYLRMKESKCANVNLKQEHSQQTLTRKNHC
jgi:hypothetical protein